MSRCGCEDYPCCGHKDGDAWYQGLDEEEQDFVDEEMEMCEVCGEYSLKDNVVDGVCYGCGEDFDPINPRDLPGNLTTMICLHRRYDLGDKHNYKVDDFSGWEELEQAILKDNPGCLIRNLYLYDHSGPAIRTSGFGDVDPGCWDWGQVGFVVIDSSVENAEGVLESEVEEYNEYLQG